MLKLTLISRLSDTLALTASMDEDNDLEQYKKQQKQLLKQLTLTQHQTPKHLTVESGGFNFHILTENGVCYMTLCEKGYPSQLAYSFLEELKKEFVTVHGAEVDKVERPYAFIKFDTFIQKTKRVYSDTRTRRNVEKLKAELQDVQQIIKRNITDVLNRGKKLNDLHLLSNDILDGAKSLKKGATDLNRMYWWKTYGPAVVVIAIIFLVLVIRFYFCALS